MARVSVRLAVSPEGSLTELLTSGARDPNRGSGFSVIVVIVQSGVVMVRFSLRSRRTVVSRPSLPRLRGGSERAYLGNIPIMIGGDLIVAVDGKRIDSQQDLAQVMNNHRAGDTVNVTIFRNKKKMDVSVVLGEAREQV